MKYCPKEHNIGIKKMDICGMLHEKRKLQRLWKYDFMLVLK